MSATLLLIAIIIPYTPSYVAYHIDGLLLAHVTIRYLCFTYDRVVTYTRLPYAAAMPLFSPLLLFFQKYRRHATCRYAAAIIAATCHGAVAAMLKSVAAT